MTQKTTYFLVVKLIKNNSVQCNAWGNAMHMGYFSALFALAKWVIIIVFLIVFPIAFEPQLFLKIASIKDNDNNHGNFCFRVCTWIISEQTEPQLLYWSCIALCSSIDCLKIENFANWTISVQVILFEIDCAIFYTNIHELFCQLNKLGKFW